MEVKNEIQRLIKLRDLITNFQDPAISESQKKLYTMYLTMLVETNDLYNLTAIIDPEKIVSHHLQDSLSIIKCIDMNSIRTFVDIGTGAGFPGIPLKIYFPEKLVILIEVSKKKILFLERVIQELNLENIIIYPYDWRTFLRKTHFDVDLFLSRASLHPEELLRIFKPTSRYKESMLVYYASDQWKPSIQEESYIYDQRSYLIENKKRTLIFFKNVHAFNHKDDL